MFGITGWSGAGKTTLLTRLVPVLVAQGLRVSTVKHAHHGFDMDKPGKDSWLHRQAGATEVLVASGTRWALLHETGNAPEASLSELLTRLAPTDLVLVEGFKRDVHPKLAVHRHANGKALPPPDPAVVAIASDVALPGCDVPILALDGIGAIAELVLRHAA